MPRVSLFLAGVICPIIQSNDGGLFAYILFVFGVWEIGVTISDYFFNDGEDTDKERPWKEIVKKFKVDVIRITIPMLLSMVVEVVMGGTGFKIHTLMAYLFIFFKIFNV